MRATDPVANTDPTPATRTFTVAVPDTIAPSTTITKHSKKETFNRKARVAFTSSEPGSTFQCKLDRKAWKICTSTYKVKAKPGKHKMEVEGQAEALSRPPSSACFISDDAPVLLADHAARRAQCHR